jgi:hypothetical protein
MPFHLNNCRIYQYREGIQEAVRLNGGTIIETLPNPTDDKIPDLVIISQPAGFRRFTYLQALARGEC